MAVLTDKEQALLRTIGIRGMTTHRACLARIVRIHLDCHRRVQESLVGNHALQLFKGPCGGGRIRFTLLPGGFLALLAAASFTDVCQVLQTNEAVWVLVYDAFRDHMIGVLLQPSLSSTHHDESSRSGASAFFLKTLSQSRVMIRFGNNPFARMKGPISSGGSSHRQVAHTNVYTGNTSMGFWGRVCYLKRKGDEHRR